MIGWFRFVLAYLVAACHLGGPSFDRANATFAVQAFFVVSGFLMTAVLNGPYKGRPLAFWSNRFLKLFPPYYVVAALIVMAVLIDPTHYYVDPWELDWSPGAIFANLTIVPLAFGDSSWRLVGPTWSIGVEILNYAVIFAVSAKGPRWALAVLLIGVAWHLNVIATDGFYMNLRYWRWYAALVPFSVGALAFFASRRWPISPAIGLGAAALWILNLAVGDWVERGYVREVLLWYANIGLVAVLTAGLAPLRRDGSMRRLDAFVGDLAYPVFLVHGLVGSILSPALMKVGLQEDTPAYFIACSLPILAAAILLSQAAAYLIEPLRDRMRKPGRPAGAIAALRSRTDVLEVREAAPAVAEAGLRRTHRRHSA